MANSEPAHKESKKETSKKRKAEEQEQEKDKAQKKRVQVEAISPVVEVVYDDSAPREQDDEEDAEKPAPPPMSDLDWLRARTSRTLGLVSDDEEASDNEDARSEISAPSKNPTPEPQAPATPPATDSEPEEDTPPLPAPTSRTSTAESKIMKTGRLFIRNLVYGVTEDDLRAVFSPYGEIEEVSLPSFSPVRENMMIK